MNAAAVKIEIAKGYRPVLRNLHDIHDITGN